MISPKMTQHDKDISGLEALRHTIKTLRAFKPEERGEKARRYAVTITEVEKALAYYILYVVNDGAGE
jgi:hypothetical protein